MEPDQPDVPNPSQEPAREPTRQQIEQERANFAKLRVVPEPPPFQSGLGWSLAAIFLCWIPFVGFIGVIGVLLALTNLGGKPKDQGDWFALVSTLIIGGLAIAAAGVWTAAIAQGSCPHIYAFDGQTWRLDADPLSGALLQGAERQDWDRLESLQPVAGQYRIRIVDELQETDYIDELALLVVDHQRGSVVLPTPTGELLAVRAAESPLRAADGQGRDVLASLRAADGLWFSGRIEDFAANAKVDPREHLSLTFARPHTDHAVLWLRAHSTPFAEEAYAHYLGTMGPGLGSLMRLAQTSSTYPYQQRVADEIHKLGLALAVRVEGSDRAAIEVGPIGPAIQRDFALMLDLPPGASKEVTVELAMTPLFWALDQVQLAPAPRSPVSAQRLLPTVLPDQGGRNVAALLANADGQRLVLQTKESVELAFAAPPVPADSERTVILSIRGYYEMAFGGRGFLNPVALLAHQLGLRTLPRVALDFARTRRVHP